MTAPDLTPAPLPPERLAEIRVDLAAVPAAPWCWIGSRGAGGPELVTDHSGRQYLLRAVKPTDQHGEELLDPVDDSPVYGDLAFRDRRDGEKYSTMRSGNRLAIGRTDYDPDSIVGVDNPVARWIERSAAHVEVLLAEVDRLRTTVGDRNATIDRLSTRVGELETERAKYVGVEPTIAEEMQHLNSCLMAVYDLVGAAKKGAGRWESPLPVPEWVEAVEQAAGGDWPRDPKDRRRSIYVDGKGNAWIDAGRDEDGNQDIAGITDGWRLRSAEEVRVETGGLREIGRCW